MPEQVIITPASVSCSDAAGLIAQLDLELNQRYPELDNSRSELKPEQVSQGKGVFLIARIGNVPVGCGAVCKLDYPVGEIRRMYVKSTFRGAGIGHRLLAELESYAVKFGVKHLVLGTGERQPEALRLYAHSGFTRIPNPPPYADSDIRIFMAKTLGLRQALHSDRWRAA
jgi:putative acetyltransferase